MMKKQVLLLFFVTMGLLVKVSAQQKPATGDGTVTGKAELLSLCPKEPCNIPAARMAEIYGTYQVVVYDSEKRELQKTGLSRTGTFSIKMSPGSYYAAVVPRSGEAPGKKERFLRVFSGKDTNITLEYDAGMK